MATEDLGNLEWERSKISQQDINMLKKLGISGKQDAPRFPKEESYPNYQCNIGGDEEEVPAIDAPTRTSTSHTLVVSEVPVEGEESSPPQQNIDAPIPPASPLVPSSKRARVETIMEPTLQLGSSSTPLLDDPLIKEFIRFGAQFVGYRDYASKAEEKLAEANERANTLAQKLKQIEEARKKAKSDANSTSQEFELEDPDNDPLLDTLAFLEFHGIETREGINQAKEGLSRLFPYFFPKKEEPATFLALAKCFNPPEDLGLKLRQENMKLIFDNYSANPHPADVFPASSFSKKILVTDDLVEGSSIKHSPQDLQDLRQQLQSMKKQTLAMMEQSRKASERERIALQQAQDAIAAKEAAISEAEKATARENLMLDLIIEASADMSDDTVGFLDLTISLRMRN
ncbi:hypothetical protein QYE76_065601 [Lolium multiflorum]|uniref:Uncharacterized protein n=1 Tax=Lolium multiflorum TaxID=4521 RepID=A0AAD8S8T7_LOLMU|nr:hypothetical protein QYE76_065601 [Lolium multiflorum]